MPEPVSQAKLKELEERWRTDRSPRVFLPLADELRRVGRLPEAIRVLVEGLEHHADSISGLVAVGRCLLDSGDASRAAEYLERAIERDPAQLVANQLLAESRLRLGDLDGARERLEVCRLLGGRGSELDEMEARLAGAAESAPPAANLASFETPIFDLSSPAPLPALSLPHHAGGAGRRSASPFGELLDGASSRRRIAARFASEGIFVPPTAANRSEPPVATSPLPEPTAAAAPAAPPIEPLFFPREAIGREVERDDEGATWSLESVPAPEAAPPAAAAAEAAASSTLAALYLEQGHLGEAEAEYRQVLATRPDDAAAQAGLAAVAARRATEPAVAPRAAFAPEAAAARRPAPGGLTQRKIARLRGLADRLQAQREAERRVS